MVVVTATDCPKSVPSRYVIENFGGVLCCDFFEFFVGHMTESDIFLLHLWCQPTEKKMFKMFLLIAKFELFFYFIYSDTHSLFQIQGNLMLASIFQLVLGCSGLMGFFLQFIGPLTIAPTISLIGLSLTGVASDFNKIHWGISLL